MNALETIEQHPKRPELRTILRAQLAKDLRVSLTDVPEKDLLLWLEGYLDELENKSANLPPLLYRIDLPEALVIESTEVLAQRILLREAEKVLFRWQYSS